MLTEEEKKELSEDGKNEVIELEIQGKKAIIVASFKYISMAITDLVDTQIYGKGKNAQVKVKMDLIGAGDTLLFQGWHSGDEEIKTKTKLRIAACKKLGEWVQQFADEDDDTEKKN